jgi:hypothetical protein
LPHTNLTVQSLLHYLYTSSLPPSNSSLCTPQILCSLLQIARPYKIDGLLEAVVERLHSILDSRNAAAVFNAAAMAAGGGRSTSTLPSIGQDYAALASANNEEAGPRVLQLSALGGGGDLSYRTQQALRINTSVGNLGTGRGVEDDASLSATSTAASDVSESDVSGSRSASEFGGRVDGVGEVWQGDVSAVIGLQKRGLRGLMEGRRLRERGASVGTGPSPGGGGGAGRVGLGIGGAI